MGNALRGRRVAVTEHRYQKELAAMFAREGARVVSCPLLEERAVDNRFEIEHFIREVLGGRLDVLVFFTGVGVRFMAEAAESFGRGSDFRAALRQLTVVARGPKPRAALSRMDVAVDLAPRLPTSEGLLELFQSQDVQGKRVGVQLYGSPNPEFCRGLEHMGAEVITVQVYSYAPASDRGRVSEFIQSLLSSQVDVVTFTSAPQVSSLFDVADELGKSADLVDRLDGQIVVAAIGNVTRRALARRGVKVQVVPDSPKMAALVREIGSYFRETAR